MLLPAAMRHAAVGRCELFLRHLTFSQFHSRNVINRMALRPYEIRCHLDASAHDLVEDQTGYLSILPNKPGGTTLHPHDALSQSSSPNRSHPSRPDFHTSFPAPYFHSPSHLS